MKRIAGALALLLLSGLSGCFSITAPAGSEGKNTADMTPALKNASVNGGLPPGDNFAPMPPSVPQWTEHPGEVPAGVVDHTASRQPQPAVVANQPAGANVIPADLPPLQRVNRPPPAPATEVAQAPPAPAPVPLPADMPSVTTPKDEQAVQPAGHVQADNSREPVATITTAGKPEVITPRSVTMPPTPTVKNSQPTEPRQASASGKGGAPLFRLVNTKRITLNFEVKDVGASGVSAVELWFTQDGKEWKKHDAPPQAKAYVVEVDDEGMYGFTLLARSGTGLAKEPPQPGDSPQVWVIVDLTRPDVQMTDVTPSLQAGQQTVSLKWRATDKNLGRQPITLSYAEKDEGPWKVIAAGLENVGSFNWEVPKGTPAKVLFRVEASDLAGNVGRAQMTKPVLMDNSVPSVTILNVDSNGGR
jgi:hypothetical protein